MLTNPRQERFCQYLAQGKTATEAYELAGYRPSRHNAAYLAKKQVIIDRLAQISTPLAKKTQITAETLIQRHDKIYQLALENRQLNAGVSANREISILTGHRIERAEIGAPGEFDHLSDAELEAAVRERLVALGFVSPAISNGSIMLNSASDDE
jgi:phage terminase small subunit